MVGSGAPDAVHQLLILLHDRVPSDLVPVALPAHTAHVSVLPAGLAPELVHAHLVRVDPDTGGVVAGGALAPASPHLQIVIESS